jgi:hypothetical protein
MATTAKTSAKPSTATKKTTKAAPATTDKAASSKTAAKATPAKVATKAAAKPAVKTEKPVVSTASAATKVTKAPKIAKTPLDGKQRRHYVEVAAYFMAERRGFMTGCESEDWLAAEAEIDRLFHEGKLNA